MEIKPEKPTHYILQSDNFLFDEEVLYMNNSRLFGSHRERKSEFVRKRRMEQISKNGVSIIGGAHGPTSVFIAGHSKKQH